MKLKSVRHCLIAAFLIVAWVYWTPLIVVMVTGTWKTEVVESNARTLSSAYSAALDQTSVLDRKLKGLDQDIAEAMNEQLPALLDLYSGLLKHRAATVEHVEILPYANSVARHHFFATYLALAVLIATQLRLRATLPVKFHTCGVAVGVAFYVFFNWTNWWRNLPMGQVNRTTFAYAHFDISPSGFFIQELHVFGMMLLSGYFVVLSLPESSIAIRHECSKMIAKNTRKRFEQWQVQSFLIALAYLPWTIFFWRTVTVYGEDRYFASAMCIHVVWAFLWVIASLPAWQSYHEWYDHTVNLVVDSSPEEAEKYLLIEPVSRSMLAVSAVASTVSFIYPLLQSAL